MKKLLLILCLFSINAHAEWKYISDGDEEKNYINYDTIQNEGGYKTAWFLINFNKPKKGSVGFYQSAKDKIIFDCTAKKYELLVSIYYSKKQGEGSIIKSQNWENLPRNFRSVVPDSVGEFAFDAVCRK